MTKWDMKRKGIVTAVACALAGVIVTAAVASGPPEAKCSAAKRKATAAEEKAKLACYSKAAAKNLPLDPACITKAEAKFHTSFMKAVAKGGCADPGNGLTDPNAPIQNSVGACIDHIVAALTDPNDPNAVPGKCVASKLKATAADAAGELLCYSKAAAKVTGVDPACTAKATSKIHAAFTKADSGKTGACFGDPNSVQTQIDAACVSSIAAQLPPSPPGCGNGVPEPGLGETCDDGNTVSGDACPANCFIASCVPSGSGPHVSVHYSASGTIAGLGVVLDYPEGEVGGGVITLGAGSFGDMNPDLGYEIVDEIATSGTPLANPFMTIAFGHGCQGAPAATAGDFTCTITDASNNLGNPVDPNSVTCTITIP
jgi:cysteine-rich repeat protein